jgi:hypothetical protein
LSLETLLSTEQRNVPTRTEKCCVETLCLLQRSARNCILLALGQIASKVRFIFPRSDKKEQKLQVASLMLSDGRVIVHGRSEESDLEGEAA